MWSPEDTKEVTRMKQRGNENGQRVIRRFQEAIRRYQRENHQIPKQKSEGTKSVI